MWARAMYKYHTVALSVAPKRAALAEAQSQLDATLADLQAAQSKLQARLWQQPLVAASAVLAVSISGRLMVIHLAQTCFQAWQSLGPL